MMDLPIGSVHDYDFLAGEWDIANRRLKVRGVGSDDWEEFPATSRAQLFMGGMVNVDEVNFPTKGWSGMTIRAFDPQARRWSVYWVNSRVGKLYPPVVGGFAGKRGIFYGQDDDDGRPVDVRFIWTLLGPDAAHWEQAFSYNGGQWETRMWETNWVMDLKRRRQLPHGRRAADMRELAGESL